MNVVSRRLIDSILVFPNTKTLFGDRASQAPFDIVGTLIYGDVAEIFLTQLGAIGLRFLDGGRLASINQLTFTGVGAVPDSVSRRHTMVVELQGQRLLFTNFVAASLFGRLAALGHTTLSGAVNVGMADILQFEQQGDVLAIENTTLAQAMLRQKLAIVSGSSPSLRVAHPQHVQDAVQFTEGLAVRETEFAYANLHVCMAMTYQAAILHEAQHAPASFALNFSVAEALINEIFFAYGAVSGEPRKGFATREHSISTHTRGALRGMKLERKLMILREGGLLGPYLVQRLQNARTRRNDLMHAALPIAVTESGHMQTMVRDLWALLVDGPFDLNAGYSMRL